jgi:hypothetical protein
MGWNPFKDSWGLGTSDWVDTAFPFLNPGSSSNPIKKGIDTAIGKPELDTRYSDEAVRAQMEMFNKMLEMQRPFMEFGADQLPALQQMLSGGTSPRLEGISGQLGGLFNQMADFKVDPNDPVFKFREEQLNKQLAQRLAGSGKLDSRQGLDVFRAGNLALTGSEADRQFGQLSQTLGLGGAFMGDIANLENIPFNRLMQSVGVGTGATGQAGAGALQTGSNLANIYQNLGLQQNQANMAGQQNLMDLLGTGLGLMALL